MEVVRPPAFCRALGPRWFTGAVWVSLSIALFSYVWTYGPNVPWEDDWRIFVPVLTGAERPTAGWLWYQYRTGHRMPATKIILYALSLPTHGDFRAGMVLSVLLLSAVALTTMTMAARIRGSASYADAFFPLALLHWGHAINVLHYCQVFFTGVVASYIVVVLIIVEDRWRGSASRVTALGAGLVLLALHGLMGPAYAAPLAAWMVVAAAARARGATAAGWRDAALLLLFVTTAAGLVVAYYVGYEPNPAMPASPSVLAMAMTAAQALSMSLGRVGPGFWPISALAIVTLTAVTGAVILVTGRRAGECLRAGGLLAAMISVLVVLLAIGVGRAGLGPAAGFADRYALLSVPLLVCVYFAWVLEGGTAGRWIQAVLFATACAVAVVSVAPARELGTMRRTQAQALERDVARGLTPEELANRYYLVFLPWNRELMREGLEMLRLARMGPYAHISGSDAGS